MRRRRGRCGIPERMAPTVHSISLKNKILSHFGEEVVDDGEEVVDDEEFPLACCSCCS